MKPSRIGNGPEVPPGRFFSAAWTFETGAEKVFSWVESCALPNTEANSRKMAQHWRMLTATAPTGCGESSHAGLLRFRRRTSKEWKSGLQHAYPRATIAGWKRF